MATQILKSIKGKVVRLTRLDDCGEVVEGSCTTVVSDCFVSVTMAAEVEEGDEYLQKNAFGDFCINDKDVDRIKRVNVSIEFAEINPDSLDIIANAQPVVSGGNTIGSTIGLTLRVQRLRLMCGRSARTLTVRVILMHHSGVTLWPRS
jgi:hypothetical protein